MRSRKKHAVLCAFYGVILASGFIALIWLADWVGEPKLAAVVGLLFGLHSNTVILRYSGHMVGIVSKEHGERMVQGS